MKTNSSLRKIWHDLYYRFTGRWGIDFALRCKQVAESVDLNSSEMSFKKRLQISLHLSLCQACQNYSDYSLALRKLVIVKPHNEISSIELDQMNKKLIKNLKK